MMERNEALEELKDKKAAIDRGDTQETKEREEAAEAYFKESEKHFVDYITACIEESRNSYRDIRETWADCWEVYNENEPAAYGAKEDWQSRVIIPKPHQTVQFGAAAIKKAFSPKFLTVQNARNKPAGEFWQKVMEFHLNEEHGDFVPTFTDATTMGMAVGMSQEVIPRWVSGKGLEFTLTEPWKIYRDPETVSRDPQSGMYWIHQEYVDYWVLKEQEKKKRYTNVDAAFALAGPGHSSDDPFMSKEAIDRRRAQIHERSSFRKSVSVYEFWGVILDPKGNLLLDGGECTLAGGRIIGKPRKAPLQTLRWPGIGFSPLPSLLGFGGRGLLQGVITLWQSMNTIACLYEDYMKWLVNPEMEINTDALNDPRDVLRYPGKKYLVKDTIAGQQAVRTVDRRSRINDVLPHLQYWDQQMQRGSFVTDAVQGLPGWRKDITYRESSQNLDQAMGVYSLMGENIEKGAMQILRAAQEIVALYATYEDYQKIFSDEELQSYGIVPNSAAANGVSGVPALDGTFHVSGIQALMRDAETLANLRNLIVPLAEKETFAPYIRPLKVLRAIEHRVNLTDEEVIVDDDTGKGIEAAIQEQAKQAGESQRRLQAVQEALGVTNLTDRIVKMAGGGESSPEKGDREPRGQ